jgi:hypothetical protein
VPNEAGSTTDMSRSTTGGRRRRFATATAGARMPGTTTEMSSKASPRRAEGDMPMVEAATMARVTGGMAMAKAKDGVVHDTRATGPAQATDGVLSAGAHESHNVLTVCLSFKGIPINVNVLLPAL